MPGLAYRDGVSDGCRGRGTDCPGWPAYGECMNLFGHLRRAARRHPHLADAAIAAAVFVAATLTTFHGTAAGTIGNRGLATTAAVAACGALAARQLHPVLVLAVSAVAAEVFLAATSGTADVLILLAPCIALYTVADVIERRRGLLIGVAALAACVLAHSLLRVGVLGPLGPQNIAFTALGGLAIAAGDSSRNRRAYLAEVERRAARAELEREQDARRRVAEERLRIARDLHDSVGHHLALISVQSDVAARATDADGGAAREALAHVKSASRKALAELRDTVSLLREPGEPVAPTEIPAAGLDALDELLDGLRAAGLAVECRVTGSAVPLAPAADLTAYRVIQESLTNVRKHSAGRQARLALGYERGELSITVDDLGGPESGGGMGEALCPGGRHGIEGMRERVLAIGGRFHAGPWTDDGFRVTAALPYRPLALTGEVLAGGTRARETRAGEALAREGRR
jgi:signal transduction histidine kinase